MNNVSIFKSLFGNAWESLPTVIRCHYDLQPFSSDRAIVTGEVTIVCRGIIKLVAPVLWWLRGIPPVNEKNVPTVVEFKSAPSSGYFYFERWFTFSTRNAYAFQSRMRRGHKDDDIIERMAFGLSWHFSFRWENQTVIMRHLHYGLSVGNFFLPLPITWILGSAYAEEQSVDDKHFKMRVSICHPWWGELYRYSGFFKLSVVEDGTNLAL